MTLGENFRCAWMELDKCELEPQADPSLDTEANDIDKDGPSFSLHSKLY